MAGRKKKSEQMSLFVAGASLQAAERAAERIDERPAPPPPATKPPLPTPTVPRRKRRGPANGAGDVAAEMAKKQREISISEFFTKNRHLLGFDNPKKALLTTIKEAVDNSLDACEEARILPDVDVTVTQVAESRYTVRVRDNGPGIVKLQIPKIFGKLLYGSKFHRLRQSRGQQGIGISAAGMYGQLTTGKPIKIVSKTESGQAHYYEIQIDTRKNNPEVVRDEVVEWDGAHGTQVEIELEAVHKRGRHSVDDYLRQTALANPHAQVRYTSPDREEVVFPRAAEELPVEPREIKPHPYGVELGALIKLLAESKARNLPQFLRDDFSRVSTKVAMEICQKAEVDARLRPAKVSREQVDRIHKAIPLVKIMAPPTNCLSPIGEALIRQGLEQKLEADFYTASTRPPSVYRGNPFQVEAGLAWGGNLPGDEPIVLYRFANRVPLQYQQSACAMTRAVISTPWRNYNLVQPRGALPQGAMILMVHVASAWVPFTSESKEAVAHYPEILKEIKLALMECGRRLGSFLSRRRRDNDEAKKRSYIEMYLPHVGIALKEILGLSDTVESDLVDTLKDVLERSRGRG